MPELVSAELNEGAVATGLLSRPVEFVLSQNTPNPFNPVTTITYGVTRRGPVRLVIYNMLGQQVVTLADDVKGAGYYTISWAGRDALGREVASGTYLYQLTSPEGRIVKRMTLVK